MDDGNVTAEQMNEIESYLGASLPASADGSETRAKSIRGGIDDALLLRLKLPSEDVNDWLTTLGFSELPREGFFGAMAAEGHPEWFQTSSLEKVRGAELNTGSKAIQVTIDESDPSISTLYLMAFEL